MKAEDYTFKDVMIFLANDIKELTLVKHRMIDVENERTRPVREAEEAARIAALPMKPCRGLLGKNECGNSTPGGFMCDDCNYEFSSDPDAYK